MWKKLDHIAIAVNSIEEKRSLYEDVLCWPCTGVEVVESEKVRVAMFDAPSAKIELLEPLEEDSPIQKFLEKRGEGLHHLCYGVTDLVRLLDQLRQQGIRILEPAPRRGAGGSLVAFLHPKSTGGLLIELKELQGGAHE